MRTILLEGHLDPEPTYNQTTVCQACNTLFEFDVEETHYDNTGKRSDISHQIITLHVHCPFCSSSVYVQELYTSEELMDIVEKSLPEDTGEFGKERLKEVQERQLKETENGRKKLDKISLGVFTVTLGIIMGIILGWGGVIMTFVASGVVAIAMRFNIV